MNSTSQIEDLSIHTLAADVSHVPKSIGGITVCLCRMTPDASPGRNQLIITGLPTGTQGITAWITEIKPDGTPHAGGAWFNTTSVQLGDNGTTCRVLFTSSFNTHLPAAAQLMFG